MGSCNVSEVRLGTGLAVLRLAGQANNSTKGECLRGMVWGGSLTALVKGWVLGHPILGVWSNGRFSRWGCSEGNPNVQVGVSCRMGRDVDGWGADGGRTSRQVTLFHHALRVRQVTVA